MPGAFYRPVDAEILQGDIFESAPSVFLKPPLEAVRGPISGSKGRSIWGVYGHPIPGQTAGVVQPNIGGPFHFESGEQIAATCNLAKAIVLSHDCDIENDPDHRLIALVRPLAPVTNPEHRQFIIENRNSAYFYLPDSGNGLEESYVDFRRITAISRAFLVAETRMCALTPFAVEALQAQLIRHFTHRNLIIPTSFFALAKYYLKNLWR